MEALSLLKVRPSRRLLLHVLDATHAQLRAVAPPPRAPSGLGTGSNAACAQPPAFAGAAGAVRKGSGAGSRQASGARDAHAFSDEEKHMEGGGWGSRLDLAEYQRMLDAGKGACSLLWLLVHLPGGVEALQPVALPQARAQLQAADSRAAPYGGGGGSMAGATPSSSSSSCAAGGPVPSLVEAPQKERELQDPPARAAAPGPPPSCVHSLADMDSGLLGRRWLTPALQLLHACLDDLPPLNFSGAWTRRGGGGTATAAAAAAAVADAAAAAAACAAAMAAAAIAVWPGL